MDSAKEIAETIYYKRKMNLNGGILISNPIPEEYSLTNEMINKYIDEAIKKANELGIKGKDITPFLLKTIKEATKGQSLEANIHLVFNNAYVGSLIAKELSKLHE